MGIQIHSELKEEIWQKASELLIATLSGQLKSDNKVLLLLSGGSAVKLYRDLAQFIKTSDLNFDFLAVGQVDERFRPHKELRIKNYELSIKNNDINAEVIKDTGLWEICDKKGINYYLMSQEGSLEEATKEYDQTTSKLFKEYTYRLAVLGIGEDGHTAGLIPGYEKKWNKESYVVGYNLRQNGPRGPFCQGGFLFRISLTPKALKELDYALVVACGEWKTDAIRNVLNPENAGKIDKYPAAIIQKIKKVDLSTDQKGH